MSVISVIVPIYKVENYLRRCADSILAQTFTDFELILVDDGSPDNCGIICDEYAEKDSRIHVIHKQNGGLSDARNVGIDWAFEKSNSEWITFIDSDDWIHPKYLEALYNAIKETGCSMSFCGFERTEGEDPAVYESLLAPEVYNSEDFYCEKNVNAVIAVCKLYKKSDFKDIRYPVGKLHEDEFTTYKILFKYENLAFVDQPLYFYYQNPNSIMQSKWSVKKLDSIEALKGQVEFFLCNDYSDALKYSITSLLINIHKHYKKINDCNDKSIQNKYLPQLKKEMRRVLRLATKKGVCSVNNVNDIYLYELTFPTEMKFYWYWQALKRKIRRK